MPLFIRDGKMLMFRFETSMFFKCSGENRLANSYMVVFLIDSKSMVRCVTCFKALLSLHLSVILSIVPPWKHPDNLSVARPVSFASETASLLF